ncbi:MAG: leucine-rich repeat domain-containing protein [Bacteroidales bacterium]|nr:leucine-rich repeat domain-containing protein [Bacteroidales bacterium]
MKKSITIIVIILGLYLQTWAYDFQSEQLLYTILNTNPPSVELDGHVNGTSAQGDLVIPEEVTFDGVTYIVVSIRGAAFYECKLLKSISIPHSIKEIGNLAFGYCSNIDEVYYNAKNCADIDNFKVFPFYECTGHLIIGDSVDRIPNYMFRQGYFNQLTIIGNSNTVIGEYAFLFCEKLSGTLSLGKVAHIERGAFLDNDTISITSITIDREQPPTLEFAAFYSINKNISVNVPCGSIELYQNAEYWNEFTQFNNHLIYSVQAISEDENKGVVDIIKEPDSCDDLMVEVSAVPNDGYEFLHWEIDGDMVSNENPYSFELDKDVSLIARFGFHPDSLLLPNSYGFLYQPNHATITLDPNSSMGSEYGDFQAGFQYYPSGLLKVQRALSVHPAGEICDYDHTYRFTYDADLHVVQQNDTYYGDMGAVPYQNHYVYEDGLLTNYTRHFENYHEDEMILEDSTSYAYDELRRLQTEKQLRVNRYYKELSYEYHDNETVITTEGYSNGTNGDWIRLDKETRGFSEDSLLLTQQNEPYNDSATLVTYGYDGQGHLVSALTQKRYNGVWENQKLVQYLFNPDGRLTLAETKLWQENEWVDANRALYELDEMGYPAMVTFEKWDGEAWVNGVWQADFYLYNEDHLKQQNDMLYGYRNSIHKIEFSYIVTDNPREPLLPDKSEWYYEIENEDGSITYQHLQCVGDTTLDSHKAKVIVRTNQIYDKQNQNEISRECIIEEDNIVYWWNKELQEFTMLYDLGAEVGDGWKIHVKHDSITMHVDAIEYIEYEGRTYKMLQVSDLDGLFSGSIVCGIGHLTSFFPERLMNRDKGYRVEGMRCYWVEDELVFKYGDEDCDAVYAEWHNGIEEDDPSTSSGTLVVYPNPANNILFVQTLRATSLPDQTYRITNLMGQTLLTGNISAETQQIDITILPAGMYFISVGRQTVKFVVK